MPPSCRALRSFAITFAIAIEIIGQLTSGFTVYRTDNNTTPFVISRTDLSTVESLQLQFRNDSDRPNDIEISIGRETNKTTDKGTSSAHPMNSDSDVPITTETDIVAGYTTDLLENITQSLSNVTETININNLKESDISTTDSNIIENTIPTTDQTDKETEIITTQYIGESQTTLEPDVTKENDMFETTTETSANIVTSIEINTTELVTTPTYDSSPLLDLAQNRKSPSLNQYLSTSSSDSTETLISTDESYSLSTQPSWKKYITIVRKRVTDSEETIQSTVAADDAMKAETSNTHLNFEQDIKPTPWIDEMLYSMIVSDNSTTAIQNLSPDEFRTEASSTESAKTKRTEMVQSKRAGFLHNSEKLSSDTTPISVESNSENYSMLPHNDAKDIKANEFKSFQSQSQLAEDAMKEELLKEELLNNHKAKLNKYITEEHDNDSVKLGDDPLITKTTAPVPGTDTSLSVQPIGHERTRTTLYTVNNNYKPMKKIDVQPSKPFLRDPDDNSWRNESISSLGIVFKAKNSSKSFKEVLKNKTQTELNNQQEKENRNDVPDLRVRLEKIAEVRKTKKKKNRYGEDVYSDYEEGNSGETTTTSALDETSNILSTSPVTPDIATEITTTTPTSKQRKTKDKNKFDLFQNLGIPRTSEKTGKYYNFADYYDTTDEYDADYVTMSNIDLKKFTIDLKTTSPPTRGPTVVHTEPAKPQFPDKKPTVQYFPPRTTEPVTVNNVNTDFERKVNLYTFKDIPIKMDSAFETLPELPVSIDGPHTRPTARPANYAEFTPDDMRKSFYLTTAPRSTPPRGTFILDGNYNRGAYVIKHYRDFLDEAAKAGADDQGGPDFAPLTARPPPLPAGPPTAARDYGLHGGRAGDYEYESQFRKDVLRSFIDNFNQNSERFKVDFPILYNSSIVHRGVESGGSEASSQVFLKRLYEAGGAGDTATTPRPCEGECARLVELSPAYELHYYVPEQEERAEPDEPPRHKSRPLPPPPQRAL